MRKNKMKNLITKLHDKAVGIYIKASGSRNLKACLGWVAISLIVLPQIANAAGIDGMAGIDELVTQSDTLFNGKLMKITINAVGLGAIVWAFIGGFKIMPLFVGIGIIAFQALYSSYVKKVMA
jgi:hypothetical protein